MGSNLHRGEKANFENEVDLYQEHVVPPQVSFSFNLGNGSLLK